MKRLLKYYIFTVSLIMILTLGTAAFITAGEKSAEITKGIETKKIRLTEEILPDELEKIKDTIFSFLPFRE